MDDTQLAIYLKYGHKDPMYPVVVAGEAIAKIMIHIRGNCDLDAESLLIPRDLMHDLFMALPLLTDMLEKNNEVDNAS